MAQPITPTVAPSTGAPTQEEKAPNPPPAAKPATTKEKDLKGTNFKIPLKDIILPQDVEWNREGTRDPKELIPSLKEVGQLIALVVRKEKGKYLLVDGRRRYMAMKEAGIKEAFVSFTEGDTITTKLKALAANLNRKAMDPIELSNAFCDLAKNGCTHRQIARANGVSDGFVSQHVALKNLSDVLRTEVKKGTLSVTQCRELLRIDQEKYESAFERFADKALTGGWDASKLKDGVTLFLQKQKEREDKKAATTEAKKSGKGKNESAPTKKEETRKGRPLKVKEYDPAMIKLINKTSLLGMLQTIEEKRARSKSTLNQRYLAGVRDGLEIAGGLRDE